MSDIETAAAHALTHARILLPRWLPGGKWIGNEWVVRNPRRSDRNIGSFKINFIHGRWDDFADTIRARKKDLVGLYAWLYSHSIHHAAECIMSETLEPPCGLVTDSSQAAYSKAECGEITLSDNGLWTMTDDHGVVWNHRPCGAVTEEFYQEVICRSGPPSNRWIYWGVDAGRPFKILDDGLPHGRVALQVDVRHDRNNGKAVISWTPWESHLIDPLVGELTIGRWFPRALPANRPIYGLDRLAAAPEALVGIVEGAKSADAGQRLSHTMAVISWPGGAKAVRKVDWSPLKGRHLLQWPDNDAPGIHAMDDIADLAIAAGALSVNRIDLNAIELLKGSPLPTGYDAADALAEGCTADMIGSVWP